MARHTRKSQTTRLNKRKRAFTKEFDLSNSWETRLFKKLKSPHK